MIVSWLHAVAAQEYLQAHANSHKTLLSRSLYGGIPSQKKDRLSTEKT
jgi:hypothetical protein